MNPQMFGISASSVPWPGIWGCSATQVWPVCLFVMTVAKQKWCCRSKKPGHNAWSRDPGPVPQDKSFYFWVSAGLHFDFERSGESSEGCILTPFPDILVVIDKGPLACQMSPMLQILLWWRVQWWKASNATKAQPKSFPLHGGLPNHRAQANVQTFMPISSILLYIMLRCTYFIG